MKTDIDFTHEETARAEALVEQFNREQAARDGDYGEEMVARSMDADGFIFAVIDDLTGSTIATVHEKDLASYRAA
jgi:hypothetical protein